ncbi:MAG: hypothetical protein Tsb0032_14430 [Kiloniellaceae bacterium]
MSDPEDPARGGEARRRRRNRPQRVFDTSVPSPCIAVCQVDPKTSLCLGCRRHIDEIRNWPILSAEEKRAILAELPKRD